eukprot:199946-Amphidinium_carterae.1
MFWKLFALPFGSTASVDRMKGLIPRLHDSCLGLVGNQFLLERGIFTAASHVLRLSQASKALSDFVQTQQTLLASMPRAWFRPFGHHAQQLFGLPVRYHSAELIQMLLRVKAVHGLGPDVCSDYDRAQAQFEHSGLDTHPLEGWLRRGALYTRRSAFQVALRENWVSVQRDGGALWKDWPTIKKLIKQLHTPHVEVAKDALRDRLNYTCSSLEPGLL